MVEATRGLNDDSPSSSLQEQAKESLHDEHHHDEHNDDLIVDDDEAPDKLHPSHDDKRNGFQLFPGNRDILPGEEGFDEENAHVGFVVNEWAGGTSVVGVAEIANSVLWKPWKRMIWLVLVLASSGLMVWQIEVLIREYKSYAIVTDTSTIVPKSMEFPEITVCNENALSQSRIDFYGISEPKNESQLQLLSQTLAFEDVWFNPNFDTNPDLFALGNSLMPGLILNAKFNDAPEYLPNTEETWKEAITPYGRCWSFQTNERVLRPGIRGGLEAEFFLNQEDYNLDGSGFASLLIFAQQPGTIINNQLPYIAASPGRATVVSIRMSDFEREKEAPWARCRSKAPEYTQAQCRVDCINAALRKTCQCREWGDSMQSRELPYCTEKDNGDCTAEFYQGENDILDTCDCSIPPCHSINFDMAATEQELAQHELETLSAGIPIDFMLKNYVGLRINFDKIEYNSLTESKAVTFAELLGNIGGSMGLFLGISAISIFEVFGDLAVMRLIPRICGYRNLYGLGVNPHH